MRSEQLTIGKTRSGAAFRLPLDAVTQTLAVLAKRGAGKTHTATVLVEEMIAAHLPVAVLDPLDVWWGLTSSKDGKKAGLSVVVFGGAHGDVPLDEHDGKIIADWLVEHRVPAVLSMRHLSKSAQRRFVTDFATWLYHRKGEAAHREPLHLVIDEADAFCPQKVQGASAPMVGAIDDIVRRGRSSGLGVTLISQRPAVVNKDVLSQAEVLIALQTVGPHDRKALQTWIEAHDTESRGAEFMDTLAALPRGTAWVWSPSWLGVFELVAIRDRTTFDSSATPGTKTRQAQPKKRAEIDLAALRIKLASTIERARADDPAHLKRRIAELEAELKAARAQTQRTAESGLSRADAFDLVDRVIAARDTHWVGDLDSQIRDTGVKAHNAVIEAVNALGNQLDRIRKHTPQRLTVGQIDDLLNGNGMRTSWAGGKVTERLATPDRAMSSDAPPRGPVSRGVAHDILRALALGSNLNGVHKTDLAAWVEVRPKNGNFNNQLGALVRDGLVQRAESGFVITRSGLEAIHGAEPMEWGEPRMARHDVAGVRGDIFRLLRSVFPGQITKEELAALAGVAPNNGNFNNQLGRLVGLGVLCRAGKSYGLNSVLFG